MDLSSQTIKLKDGRVLGFAEYGDLKGKPFFSFHGWPSSRHSVAILDRLGKKYHMRIISPDRPGYGLSDYQHDRTLLNWPDDVVELADTLKIKKFGVFGASGGGPYVLACAYKIPTRLTRVATIAGLGPLDKPFELIGLRNWQKTYLKIAPSFVDLVRLELWFMKITLSYFPAVFYWVSFSLWFRPPVDQKYFARQEARDAYGKNVGEALRQGLHGPARDVAIYFRPWGFSLKDIAKKVYLWHGELDSNAPVAIARYVSSHLTHCKATFYADRGHVLLATMGEEILKTLTS